MAIKTEDLVGMVVCFMQDDPQLNVLIRRREFSDPLIRVAIKLMISHFNQIHVPTIFNEKDFPLGTEAVQLYGTIFHLLNSATLLQVRNHLPYNDTGLSVGQFAKSGEYSGIADRFKQLFEPMALSVKFDFNMFQGYGGVASQYAWFGGYATIYGHATDF